MVKYSELAELAQDEYRLCFPMKSLGLYMTNKSDAFYNNGATLDMISIALSGALFEQFYYNDNKMPIYKRLTSSNWIDLREIFQNLWILNGREHVESPIIKLQASIRRRLEIQKMD